MEFLDESKVEDASIFKGPDASKAEQAVTEKELR